MIKSMQKIRFASMAIIAVLTAFIAIGCGGDGSGPQKSAEEHTEEGWEAFTLSDYSDALADFEEAITKDAEYAEAYLGAGWANFQLKNMTEARDHFQTGRGNVADTSALLGDFHAALSFTYLELNQDSQCIACADSCIETHSQYSFGHRTTVNVTDLIVAKAKSYFLMGGDSNLTKSAELVHEVISTIDLDPDNSSTWRVKGKQYDSFSEALVRALEEAAALAASS